jgi:hypothetical protein
VHTEGTFLILVAGRERERERERGRERLLFLLSFFLYSTLLSLPPDLLDIYSTG